jgi:3-methylcrotonyl-CoA carboxylase alpha subunit
VRAQRLANGDIRVDIEGRQATGTVTRIGTAITVFTADGTAQFDLVDPLMASAEVDAAPGHLAAPMPGKVIQVSVKSGDAVKRGATLMVLEAMKMEHSIAAPMDGKIARVFYKAGDLVEEGAELIAFAEEA